jgi:adenylate cyclase
MYFKKSWRTLAQWLMGASEFTSREVAAQAGVDFDQARELWRALGFPPVPDEDRVFTRSDTEMLRAAAALLDQRITAPHVLLQLTRVTGQTLGRLAEAQVSATAGQLRDLVDERAAAEDAIISATETLVPILEPFIRYAWRRHLLASLLRHGALGESISGTEQIMAVGFADLVGFTAASQALDESELAAVVDRFEALACEHIPAHGGRVVKMIGDEVMFVSTSSFNAAEIALSLIEAFNDDEIVPNVRVGVALGRTLSWEGDRFGPTVNLASRLVNLAYPGTALVSEELHAELLGRPNFFLRGLRPVRLKGIGRTRTWVLRRGGEREHTSRHVSRRRARRTTRLEKPPRSDKKRAR